MNFKRIQWIFIIAFVAVDIALLVTFFWGSDFTTQNSKTQSQTSIIEKEMSSDSITYPTLSKKKEDGYYLSVKSNSNDDLYHLANNLNDQSVRSTNDGIRASFTRSIHLSKKRTIVSQVKKLVKQKGRFVHGSEYTYNAKMSTDSTLVFNQKLMGRPVLTKMGGQLRIRVDGHRITSYTQSYVSGAKVLRARAKTVSAAQAVIWLYRHNEIPSNSKIKWVVLGYTKLKTSTNNTDIYVPTWVVSVRRKGATTEDYLRVNAFSGTMIRDSSDE